MTDKLISYTAANSMPLKLFKNEALLKSLLEGRIPPVHVQFSPTNHCNLSCTFCSCSERSRDQELSLIGTLNIASTLKDLGCQSVTITGGGEPLMHPEIMGIIEAFHGFDIEVGMVTNGLLLDCLDTETLDMIKWIRVSAADERVFAGRAKEIIRKAIMRGDKVDWAFSYVVSKNPNIENIRQYIKFANDHDFTHVRVVPDLIDPFNIDMSDIKAAVHPIDNSLVIYQDRKTFTPGTKRCFISLLKPLIGSDGFVYPCCGVQYAHEKLDLDMPESMRMCHWTELSSVIGLRQYFNGSECFRCYYEGYNNLLAAMMDPIDHEKFV